LISIEFYFPIIALATTYRVNVVTSDKFGSGTNANVYIYIFGKNNDTGLIDFFDASRRQYYYFNNRKSSTNNIKNA
jgi:hypothetical protein